MPVNAKQVRIKATAFRCYIDFLRIIRSLRLLSVLKADKKAIFTAASKASEAAAFLAALQGA
jgi:antirestriction protein ArdC